MFTLGPTRRIEARVEAFNLTNHVNYNNPTTNFNAGTFGRILTAQDPRIMQFAVKYYF